MELKKSTITAVVPATVTTGNILLHLVLCYLKAEV